MLTAERVLTALLPPPLKNMLITVLMLSLNLVESVADYALTNTLMLMLLYAELLLLPRCRRQFARVR